MENIKKHIKNMKVAMELMMATNDISQDGINAIELGLNGLQEDTQPSGDKVSDEGKSGET